MSTELATEIRNFMSCTIFVIGFKGEKKKVKNKKVSNSTEFNFKQNWLWNKQMFDVSVIITQVFGEIESVLQNS